MPFQKFPSFLTVAGDDYESEVFQLVFEIGDERACHDVRILDDESCEYPIEDFFSNLVYHSGEIPISISPNEARIIINDTFEKECGKLGWERHNYSWHNYTCPCR